MQLTHLLSARQEVALVEDGDALVLRGPGRQSPLNDLAPAVRAALLSLWSQPATEDELADVALSRDGAESLPRLYFELERLSMRALIYRSLAAEGRLMLTLAPMAPGWRFELEELPPGRLYELSRFAYCHRSQGHLVVESAVSSVRAIVNDPSVGLLIAALGAPTSVDALARCWPGCHASVVAGCLAYLVAAELVVAAGQAGGMDQQSQSHLDQYELHDMIFHTRTRSGYRDGPIGATFRFRDSRPPQPAIKANPWETTVQLDIPDLSRLEKEDVPLTHVLESRRSVRAHGDRPVSVRELGAFLYRTARIRSFTPIDRSAGLLYETTSRPYPSGGATYDLEVYLTVNDCEGLRRGIYYFDPANHRLAMVTDRERFVDALARHAAQSCGEPLAPQVLLTFTSRFARLSWKYSAISYALALKNVGVLYQTMYLVATAMGLAPCALGSGDSSLFAEATGLDRFEELPVGEFILGSSPDAGVEDDRSRMLRRDRGGAALSAQADRQRQPNPRQRPE
jgi:oxazoline/thiazoline dehydrogenase